MTTDRFATNPALADRLAAENAGQAWSSPQEMQQDQPGDYEHGLIDDCADADGTPWQRVWHDRLGVWFRIPKREPPAAPSNLSGDRP
jgi:hypothetical protein